MRYLAPIPFFYLMTTTRCFHCDFCRSQGYPELFKGEGSHTHDKSGSLSNLFIFRLVKGDRTNNKKRRESQDEGVRGVTMNMAKYNPTIQTDHHHHHHCHKSYGR